MEHFDKRLIQTMKLRICDMISELSDLEHFADTEKYLNSKAGFISRTEENLAWLNANIPHLRKTLMRQQEAKYATAETEEI